MATPHHTPLENGVKAEAIPQSVLQQMLHGPETGPVPHRGKPPGLKALLSWAACEVQQFLW